MSRALADALVMIRPIAETSAIVTAIRSRFVRYMMFLSCDPPYEGIKANPSYVRAEDFPRFQPSRTALKVKNPAWLPFRSHPKKSVRE